MKTAVDKVNTGKGRIVNERFAVMCAHYLFDPDFCNVASGWDKGVVEKSVQDSRRRIWIEAGIQRFGSFVELNAWLAARCRALREEVRHPEHGQFTIAESGPGTGKTSDGALGFVGHHCSLSLRGTPTFIGVAKLAGRPGPCCLRCSAVRRR